MKAIFENRFNLPDSQLISLVCNGEISFFEMLVRKYNASLYRIGRVCHLNHRDTEDLVQETHVAAFFALSRLEPGTPYHTLVIKTMLEKCIANSKKTSYGLLLSSKAIADSIRLKAAEMPGQHTDNAERQRAFTQLLEKGIQQLHHDYSIVFTLCEINGFSTAEAAEALGINETNVKIRLNRAKTLLYEKLETYLTADRVYEPDTATTERMIERVFNGINAIISVEIDTH